MMLHRLSVVLFACTALLPLGADAAPVKGGVIDVATIG